jgi:hypothetical protein
LAISAGVGPKLLCSRKRVASALETGAPDEEPPLLELPLLELEPPPLELEPLLLEPPPLELLLLELLPLELLLELAAPLPEPSPPPEHADNVSVSARPINRQRILDTELGMFPPPSIRREHSRSREWRTAGSACILQDCDRPAGFGACCAERFGQLALCLLNGR